MFWTKWVKSINTVFLVISIIASLIIGIVIAAGVNVFLGLIVAAFCIFLSYCGVAVAMTLVEISENVAELKKSGVQSLPTSSLTYASHQKNNSWVCNCGTRNDISAEFCRNCGKKPPENNSYTPSSDTWKCPKCGKENPKSTRICMDCAYNR